MTRFLDSMRALLLAGACLIAILGAPRRVDGQQPQSPSVAALAAQLGAKAQPRPSEVLDVGETFTAILEEPAKLAALGIRGMHAGARVTVARVSPVAVRVEADELEPKMTSASVTLHLDARGNLSVPGSSVAGRS